MRSSCVQSLGFHMDAQAQTIEIPECSQKKPLSTAGYGPEKGVMGSARCGEDPTQGRVQQAEGSAGTEGHCSLCCDRSTGEHAGALSSAQLTQGRTKVTQCGRNISPIDPKQWVLSYPQVSGVAQLL